MSDYAALVYATATVGARKARETTEAKLQEQVDTGELPEAEVATREDGRRVRIHTSKYFDTSDYEGEFDTLEEFEACLRESIDTGDLCDPKIRDSGRASTMEGGA